MFSGCSLGMDQIMTWILKLIGYWLNLEQVHHHPHKLIQNRWPILLKLTHMFVMFRDFGFQDQIDYIFIHQPVRQCLGRIVHLFTDEILHCLCVYFYFKWHLYNFPKSVSLWWCCLYSSREYVDLFHSLVTFSTMPSTLNLHS